MKTLFLSLALAATLTACEHKTDPVPATPSVTFDFTQARVHPRFPVKTGQSAYRESFIDQYVQGGIELNAIPATHSTGDVGILLFPNEEAIAYIGCFDNNPYNLRLFEKIAQRNDDLWFQRECAVSTQVWADNFQSLHVYSDADWDKEHPAGTPLDDILQLNYLSVEPFVKNDYQTDASASLDDVAYRQWLTRGEFRTLYVGQLSKLTQRMNMVVAGGDNALFFASAPTLAKTHTLTAEWTTTRGEVKKASVLCTPVVE